MVPLNERPADGCMKVVHGEQLLAFWTDVLDQQVRLFAPREIRALQQWRFGVGSQGVLDIGAGNATFGLRLAASFPNVQIHGIESNPELAKIALLNCQMRGRPNYSVHACKIGRDALPDSLQGRHDHALLRLVLQHCSDPVAMLQAIHAMLPPSGRVFLIEEDVRLFRASSQCSAFRRAIEIWREVAWKEGTDATIGCKLPHLLAEAGFVVESFAVVQHDSNDLGIDLGEYMVAMMRMLRATSFTDSRRRSGARRAIDRILPRVCTLV